MIDVIIACCIVGGVAVIVVAEVLYMRWVFKKADKIPQNNRDRTNLHPVFATRYGYAAMF